MHLLGVLAHEEAIEPLVDRLADALADRGRVAVITDAALARDHSGPTVYRLDDGAWTADGTGMDLGDALEAVAPDHEYAVVAGFPDTKLPRVVVGDLEFDGEPLVAAPTPSDVAVAEVVEAVDDTQPFETLSSLIARVKRAPGADRAGAIATFTGCVRVRDGDDDPPTTHLEFEKYEGVADRRMATISEELAERDGVVEVAMHHRTGVIDAGEDIVFVVVLAGHRDEAFSTVEDGINRLKAEVPIFKREVTVDETFWVHERS